MGKLRRAIALGFLALAMLGTPALVFGQSCALCYTQAASAGRRMISALRSGILILVVPPTLASIGMVFVLRRRSNKVRRLQEEL